MLAWIRDLQTGYSAQHFLNLQHLAGWLLAVLLKSIELILHLLIILSALVLLGAKCNQVCVTISMQGLQHLHCFAGYCSMHSMCNLAIAARCLLITNM